MRVQGREPLRFFHLLEDFMKDMPVSKFRTASSGAVRVSYVNRGEAKTKQSFKDECDINTIMRRYEQTGVLQHLSRGQPQYVDATSADYQASMELVVAAREMFDALPSRVRERFQNDPASMLAFVDNAENRDEAIKLGLIPAPVPEVKAEPTAVRIVADERAPVK